ncbi:MAG TPA: DUF2330 domain-containing protein [Fimbriimonadaceae bacterium]|nr:DUF2330 domain-containing protein [Fimbriimonadaceae bacterium]HRJ97383.1 DUF2330 domain-containing protein [Fimbriimonadaceae bacterium]
MKSVISLLTALLASIALGDGMMLKVGPMPGVPDLPYQRAVVSYRDGVETLIVDSRLGGTEKGDHVWVLPLPSAPKKIEKVDLSYLDRLLRAGSPIVERSPKNLQEFEVFFVVLLIVSVVHLLCVRDPLLWRRIATYLLLLIAVFFPVLWFMPVYAGSGTKGVGSSVGAYDVASLDPKQPNEPLTWLREQGAAVPDEARSVIEDYRRQGWSILVMKFVRRTGNEQPHPLRFVFPTRRPVYPMRLTGTAAQRLVLDLIVIGDRRAAVEGMALWAGVQAKGGSEGRNFVFWPSMLVQLETSTHDLWLDCWLSSYRGEFSRRSMDKDIEIGWSRPERYRARYYDRVGRRNYAVVLFAPWGGGALFIGSLAALFTARPRRWLPWVLLATLVAGGAAAAYVLWTVPVFDVETGRLLGQE